MKKLISSHLLTAVLFTAAGWLAHSVATADRLTPGESIAAAWKTQLDVLTDVQGDARAPEDVSRIARVSFSSLSMGLALQYDGLSDRHKSELAPLVVRARALEPSAADNASLAVLDCVAEAGVSDRIGEACMSSALERR